MKRYLLIIGFLFLYFLAASLIVTMGESDCHVGLGRGKHFIYSND